MAPLSDKDDALFYLKSGSFSVSLFFFQGNCAPHMRSAETKAGERGRGPRVVGRVGFFLPFFFCMKFENFFVCTTLLMMPYMSHFRNKIIIKIKRTTTTTYDEGKKKKKRTQAIYIIEEERKKNTTTHSTSTTNTQHTQTHTKKKQHTR